MPDPRNGARLPSPVAGQQRRERIREQVLDSGFARIEDLAQQYSVSTMTIHRDLDELEVAGWLRKVRGGATVNPAALVDTTARSRLAAMVTEKEQIARAALRHVVSGQTVIVDDSTTALQVAQLLPSRAPLTVITNFLAVINSLAGESEIDLIALGGSYNPSYDAFFGLKTKEAVGSLRADVLFMSTTAVTDGSCFHKSQGTVLVKRALMEAAAKRILLLDHSKFSKRALHELAPLTSFDLIIVDRETDEKDMAELKQLGIAVEVAGAPT
ncbi:DeoR/GlpR family DNA-binding transcription regulator [Streptomyces sp. NPDC059224]|uniref:DeoR/GlpR family DNA-binding transcription regulator n=1 Tax=Streptomyces sp. NPDC059224 TaxID=3346775 RepID=UPI0036BC15D3